MARWFHQGLTIISLFAVAPSALAQRGKKDAPEFTKQAVLIVSFAPGEGADARLGRRAADAVRSRAAKLINNDREVEVIDERKVITAIASQSDCRRRGFFARRTIRALERQQSVSSGEQHEGVGRFRPRPSLPCLRRHGALDTAVEVPHRGDSARNRAVGTTEATKLTDKVESCRLARLGADMLPIARAQLQAGQEAFPEAARQSLDYLGELDPYVTRAVAVCGSAEGRLPTSGNRFRGRMK